MKEFKPRELSHSEELRAYSVGRLGVKEWIKDMIEDNFTDEEITEHLVKRDFWSLRRCKELLEQVRFENKL